MKRNKETKKDLSRRDFIKTTAVGVSATALTGLGANGVKAAPPPQNWDYEADVVVVGYGGAGANTAIEAHEYGAEVLILEKNSENLHTCNTRIGSSSFHYADDFEEGMKYFKALAFGVGLPEGMGDPPAAYPHYPEQFVEEIARAHVQGLLDVPAYWRYLGGGEPRPSIPGPSFPTFPGGQHYGGISLPLPSSLSGQGKGGGHDLFLVYSKGVSDRGVKVLWETSASRLIVNADDEVIGVVAAQRGKGVNVKARRAVVITSGGFEYDDQLKEAFLPGWKWVFCGNPNNTGDGLKMAMGVGAELGHMYHNAARVCVGGGLYDTIGTGARANISGGSRIMVDNYGKRYANEIWTSLDPQRYQFYNIVIAYDITKLEYPRIPSWQVLDEVDRKRLGRILNENGHQSVGLYTYSQNNTVEIEKGWILSANSIEELAQKIAARPYNKGRMNPATLAATVAKYNEYCANQVDPEFGRAANTLIPLTTAPYYAMEMYPGGPNTEGGMIKNAKAQVISIHGEPIPRLYAAGEVASVWSFAYEAGGNQSENVVWGRIAGRNAAAEVPW